MFLLLRYWTVEERLNPALIIELCKEQGLSLKKVLNDLTSISAGYFNERDKRIGVKWPSEG